MTQAYLQCVSSAPQSTALVRYVVFTVAKAHHESQLEGWRQSNILPLQTHIRCLPKSPIVFKIDAQKVLGCKAELTTLGKCLRASTMSLCVTLSGWAYEHGRQQGSHFSPFHTEQRADAGQLQMYVVTKPDPCWLTRMWHVRWSVTRITKIAPQKTKGFMCGTELVLKLICPLSYHLVHTSKSQSCFIPFMNSLRTQPSNLPRRWQDEKKKQQFIVDSKLEARKSNIAPHSHSPQTRSADNLALTVGFRTILKGEKLKKKSRKWEKWQHKCLMIFTMLSIPSKK